MKLTQLDPPQVGTAHLILRIENHFACWESSDMYCMQVAQLREVCKELGIKGYSKLKKQELVEVIAKEAGSIQ